MTSPRAPRTLSGMLLAAQVLVVAVVVAIVGSVAVGRAVGEAEASAEQRIQDIAETIRHMPAVSDALQGESPGPQIQPIVDAALAASGLRYITIVGMDGLRVAYVDPAEVGKPVSSDHARIREGHEFRGIETGPQGETYRVKLPIRASSGEIVGTISVGMLVSDIRTEALEHSLPLALVSAVAIVVGIFPAWLVTRWLRRKFYAVAPEQLAPLLQAHQAVMDSTHEGIVTVDTAGRIQLINAEAARLLGEDEQGVRALIGEDVRALPDALQDLLSPDSTSSDAYVRTIGESVVYVQAAEVHRAGRSVGRLVSLRDRSELDRATARLHEERAAADLLRIEAHEFENRMHLVSGLIELGEYDEARTYLDGMPDAHPIAGIDVPLVSALLVAHRGVARNENVTLEVDEASTVPAEWPVKEGDLLVLANLITNAVEATGFGGRVWVLVRADAVTGELFIQVDDDGPGFATDPEQLVLGATSKSDTTRHGIGLGSVARVVSGRGGTVEFGAPPSGVGARVEVSMPVESVDDRQAGNGGA